MRNKNNTKTRIRRTEEQLIQALHDKISKLEERKAKRAIKADPALKLANKLVKSLRKAENEFSRSGRQDLANSVKAAAISLSGTMGGR